jgi:hypothetical protein
MHVITTALFFLTMGLAGLTPDNFKGLASSAFFGVACGCAIVLVNQ